MTTSPVIRLGERRVQSARVHVPHGGAWVADCVLDDVAAAVGAVTLTLGGLELRGTVEPENTGAFALGQRVRVVGGAGAWGRAVPAKGYHNDAGVKAAQVASDVAREVGETLDVSGYGATRVGPDFARVAGPASRVLEQLGVPWWVDLAGVTHVGSRPAVEVVAPYEVLDFDPSQRVATLGVDDASAVGIGAIVRDKLAAPLVVRDLEIDAGASSLRLTAWLADPDAELYGPRLVRALRALVRDALPRLAYLAPRRYRIVEQIGERLTLQAVRAAAGVPDLLMVPVSPGVAGTRAEHTPGAVCVVQFLDGDPSAPMVTHFEAADGNGWLPVGLTLDATGAVKVGPSADLVELAGGDVTDISGGAGRVVRYGDPIVFGAPGPGVVSAGAIVTHFSKVTA